MSISKYKAILLIALLLISLVMLFACGNDTTTTDNSSTANSTASDSSAATDEGEYFTLRAATHQTSGSAAVEDLQEVCDNIYEQTDGHIKIEIYPDSLLGDWVANFEDLMKGTLDVGMICYGSTYDPRMELISVPCAASGYETLAKMYAEGGYLDTSMVDISDAQGVTYCGVWLEGLQGMGAAKESTDPWIPGTDKKFLCRCPGSTNFVTTMEMMGYATTIIPFADLFTSLQTGVADGWVGGTPYLNYTQFRDVTKYWYSYPFWCEMDPFCISQVTLDKLPQEYQDIMIQCFRDKSNESLTAVQARDKEYLEKMEDYGLTIVNPTAEESETMAAAVREQVWPKMEADLSPELMAGMLSWAEECSK